eukprot:241455_1
MTGVALHSSSVPRSTVKKRRVDYSHAICGSASGVITKMILQPLDLVRTRLQVQDGVVRSSNQLPRYSGMGNAFLTIARTEGARSLYNGMSVNLVGSGVAWGTYFFIYSALKDYIKDNVSEDGTLHMRHHLAAGLVAGTSVVFTTNPIWMVKTRLQIQSHKHHDAKVRYKGPIDAFLRMGREEGLSTFYRGIGPGLSLCSNSAIQLTFYEAVRKFMMYEFHSDGSDLRAYETMGMGALSKGFSTSITYPLSLLRARMYQRSSPTEKVSKSAVKAVPKYKYASVSDAFQRILKCEGVFGFYRGLTPHLMKTVPSAALTLSFYEYFIRKMHSSW